MPNPQPIQPKAKRLAILTPEEDRVWTDSNAYWEEEGFSRAKADRFAWKELQDVFPRLKEFDGAEPGVAEEPQEEITTIPQHRPGGLPRG